MDTQICTNKEQSQRLIDMGFDKETADMYIRSNGKIYVKGSAPKLRPIQNDLFPAWSLSALIDILPERVSNDKGDEYELAIGKDCVMYYNVYYDDFQELQSLYGKTIFDSIIDMIEWMSEKKLYDFKLYTNNYNIGDIIRSSENDVPLKYEGYRVDSNDLIMYLYTEVGEDSQYIKKDDKECDKYNLPHGCIGFSDKFKGIIIEKAK